LGESQQTSLLAFPATQRQTPLALSASQRNLRFEFALPAYTRPVRYRHRLLGFSPRWSDWERTPYKEYTNLPPGPYTFEVQSSLGPALAQLSFRLAAPWYRQGWAYLIYACLLLGLGWLAIRYHRWRLRRHQRRLEIEKARELNRQRMANRNEQLQKDISRKNEELARSTMSLLRKNEILLQLKHELVRARKSAGDAFPHQAYRRLQDIIRQHMASEQDWVTFEEHFRQVHDQFFKRLKADYPELTPGDLRLAAYLRLNLSSKEIAPMLNISIRGVENKRYRLRKKMDLQNDDNLIEALMKY
ncbi:MAG: transcriptional regulator, partial [Bacteroidetes bacterium]